MARRHDWPSIRAEYVEGVPEGDRTIWLTLQDVADRHGVRSNRVRERSAKEGWPEQREKFQLRVESQRQEARSAELARLGADLDVLALQVASDGLTTAAARVQELHHLAMEREHALQIAPDIEPTVPAVDSLEMDRLSRAAAQWYGLGVHALGEAPKFVFEVETPEATSVEERDARSVALMAILLDHGLLPPEIGDVIDVSSGRLSLAVGNEQGPDRDSVAAAHEPR